MQKFNIPCIQTGEFAKLCNTNKRTLIYYDEIGLFSPAYIDDKGYRFYTENQCDIFFTISCLREIGMPLMEIKKYILKKTPADLKLLLESQQQKILQELERMQKIEEVIRTKIHLLEESTLPRIKKYSSKITIEYMEEEYFHLSDSIYSDDHSIIFKTLCRHIADCNIHHLNCGHPYGAMQATSDLHSMNWDTYAYFCTKISTPISKNSCHIKSAGEYLTTYITGNYYDTGQTYHRILDYIKKNKLDVGTFLYKEAILDELAVNHESKCVTKISMKIL